MNNPRYMGLRERHPPCPIGGMLNGLPTPIAGGRDLRIDWLRGLAMTCVIVNHSRLSSLLSWFSYERFWVVTAAEVFVVLSGIVLGIVYERKLADGGWRTVVKGLGRRALTLYASFIAVTLSVLAMSMAGVDVRSLTTWDDRPSDTWFLDPRAMDAAAWRDIAFMRYGPWAFSIVGLYVWLVVAAAPCLLALHFTGWRPVVAASWALYFWHRLSPYPLSGAESTFPLLAWQLLFVHGIALGYHRERVGAFLARCPRIVPIAASGAAAAFALFALCNPGIDGPRWLHLRFVSPERFGDLYEHYFALSPLGTGRLLNLAVGLPLAYAVLTRAWSIARPFGTVFVTLGQRSLGAFVLHVYGILLLSLLHHPDGFWTNTILQIALIIAIVALLNGLEPAREAWRTVTVPSASMAPARFDGERAADDRWRPRAERLERNAV